jgi:hypothetical protein
MLRDSFYFLVALLSLAVMIGWLSFVTLAGQVYGLHSNEHSTASLCNTLLPRLSRRILVG